MGLKFAVQIHRGAFYAHMIFQSIASANAKGAPKGALWDTRLGRDFFAAPLVSKLPDGFGSKPNPILLRKGVCEGTASANAKGTPIGVPFALAEAVGFEPTVP